MEKAILITRPTEVLPVIPSTRQQYMDLAEYFEGQGNLDLARFYRNLAQEY